MATKTTAGKKVTYTLPPTPFPAPLPLGQIKSKVFVRDPRCWHKLRLNLDVAVRLRFQLTIRLHPRHLFVHLPPSEPAEAEDLHDADHGVDAEIFHQILGQTWQTRFGPLCVRLTFHHVALAESCVKIRVENVDKLDVHDLVYSRFLLLTRRTVILLLHKLRNDLVPNEIQTLDQRHDQISAHRSAVDPKYEGSLFLDLDADLRRIQ